MAKPSPAELGQGMLLPPDGALANHVLTRVDDGYFVTDIHSQQATNLEPALSSAEQQARTTEEQAISELEFTKDALDLLARECKAWGSRSSAKGILRKEAEGKVNLGNGEQAALERRSLKSLVAGIDLRAAAKVSYARSKGITVTTEQITDDVTGKVTGHKVVATNPDQQETLDHNFYLFRSKYATSSNSRRRDRRRRELDDEIGHRRSRLAA
jgi:hypothetical protein